MQNLNGNVALVTGAARRLGRASALALAQNGASIVIHYRSSMTQAESLLEEVRKSGADGWLIQADLSDSRECESLFAQAIQSAGKIDVLINSASIFPEGSLFESEENEFFENLKINALAPLKLSKLFAAQNTGGAIINLLDARILDYDKHHVPYHLSKQALFSFTRMMSIELSPAIRVNAVAPGLILPPEGKGSDYLQQLANTNPLESWGTEKDISDAVLYLVGAGFVTGQVLYIDGGRHVKGRFYGS